MNRMTVFYTILPLSLFLVLGCGLPGAFPPLPETGGSFPPHQSFDTDKDGKADFFVFADATGRIDTIAYGTPDAKISLAAIPPLRHRHVVIILDGFGYDVVREFYHAGGLRFFSPPAKVICPYPGLTDLCLNDALGTAPSHGFEALYFDRGKNKLVGGSMGYLHGENMPYNRRLDYRAGLLTDALGYVNPWGQFVGELRKTRDLAARKLPPETIVYFVTSAGMGTKYGKEGQIRVLREIDRWVYELIWQSSGGVRVTIFSDHGHSYTPAKRLRLESLLRDKGWRVRKSLDKTNDVVYIRFGLVTCANFNTNQPAKLADDLVTFDGVELASYAEGDAVVVVGRDKQQAKIRCDNGRYAYKPLQGDPLKLKPVLASLPAPTDGFYDADELLRATVDAPYPAPLQRLWRAHKGNMAENPPDVIASLGNAYYSGSSSFEWAVKIASTHGSLNRTNSTTFIMSTVGPLPEAMRTRDIPANMKILLRTPRWPRKEFHPAK